jgi:hypothetical protein
MVRGRILAVLRVEQRRVLHGATAGTDGNLCAQQWLQGEDVGRGGRNHGLPVYFLAAVISVPGEPAFGRQFYWLRDFALGHPEATEIFAAID